MKKMLLGITGAIGSLNIPLYINTLNEFYDINVIFTKSATKFINPDGLRPLVNGVYVDPFDMSKIKVPHVNLVKEIDKFLILPTSANFLAKIANGFADDLLSLCVLNYENSVYLVPNMNDIMWNQPSVQINVERLTSYGHRFVNVSASGYEASSGNIVYSGAALPTPDSLVNKISSDSA